MKFLVVLFLYANGDFSDIWLGPFDDEVACIEAAKGLTMQRGEEVGFVIYCDDGCGQSRPVFMNLLRTGSTALGRKT